MDWREVTLARESSLPLYLQLADAIRTLIAEKKLLPMERIPVSRELQKLFYLSSVTVEKGIARLVEEGYLLRRPRIGTFVADAPPQTPSRAPLRRGTVKVVFTRILPFSSFWFNQLYRIERQLRERNISMHFLHHEEELPVTGEELRSDCLGVIFCGTTPLSLAMGLHTRKFPFVIVGSLDHYHPAVKEMDQVTGDDVQRFAAGMKFLLRLGHRRILALTTRTGSQFTRRQLEGYRRALGEFGLQADDISYFALPDVETEVTQWEEAIRNILCSGPLPTAISAYGSVAACTALRELSRLGLKVPEDISLITYDNGHTKLTVPSFTAVIDQASQDYSETAVERLCRQIEDPDYRPSPLVLRGSPKIQLNETCRYHNGQEKEQRSILS